MKVLGTQEITPLSQTTQGGYPSAPPKFSTELAIGKMKNLGNKLESLWHTKC